MTFQSRKRLKKYKCPSVCPSVSPLPKPPNSQKSIIPPSLQPTPNTKSPKTMAHFRPGASNLPTAVLNHSSPARSSGHLPTRGRVWTKPFFR